YGREFLKEDAARAFAPSYSLFADRAVSVAAARPHWPRSTLLHGVVYGVPVAGPGVAGHRPRPAAVHVSLGPPTDGGAAVLAGAGLGLTGADERRAIERVLAAFTGQLLPRLGTADGVVDVEEHEHAAGFAARPGGDGGVDRLLPAGEAGPLGAGRAARG